MFKITYEQVLLYLESNKNAELKKNKLDAKAVLGGSYAKGVWLKEDYDVDIFVRFSMKYKEDDLSKMLEKAMKKFKTIKVHGSRDYFQIKQDVNYEIIPVLAIKKMEEAQNVTDFSPWHVKWVKDNVGELRDDIRLFKKFCKAQGTYGAESYINGFSGHVVDLLVINYKGFVKTLKAVTKWKDKTVIDVLNIHKGKTMMVLNKSKTAGPLVLVDPTEQGRNASAAVGKEKFDILIKAAKSFLKKPSIEMFHYHKTDFDKLEKKGELIMFDVGAYSGKADIVGSKLLKAFEFIEKELKDFGIVSSGWDWGKGKQAVFWYILAKNELEKTYVHKGPFNEQKEHVKIFKKKYKKTFKKGQHLYAEVKRTELTVNEVLTNVLKSEYLKDKYTKILMR